MEASFEHLLKFDTLDAAEETLRGIQRRYVEFRRQGDGAGMERCRTLILKGKRRALMIAGNPKVRPEKRLEKSEIAQWFTVWLQTPDVFEDWLALRKISTEFQKRFRPASTLQSA